MKSYLFILPATSLGGAETKFFHVIRQMTGSRNVLLTQRRLADYYVPLGITIYCFEDFGCADSPMPFSIGKTIAYARAIAEVCRREKFHSVAGIMHTGLFYLSVARDFFGLRTPCIGTIEGPITAYFHSEKRNPSLTERLLIRYMLSRVPCIVVPSFGVFRDLAHNFRIPNERINIVPNGIDIEHVRSMSGQGRPEFSCSGRLVATACRLEQGKDFETLLHAFSLVCMKVDATLLIIGDGPLREKIASDTEHYGISNRVVMAGFQQNPFPYLRAADVFVLSSLFEGFGNVLVEAMALGVPVVSTDCPTGPAEIIEDNLSGLLVPMQDPPAMADAIVRVLMDDSCRATLRKNGPVRAEEFRADRMADGFRRALESVADA